ncbi:HlyD family secretion protein [Leucothrix mucor]|uniref:HlyD family secretion protein n=1 Tax=Leucothrix mucor TaxID=45248 RepID=UPI0003B72B98|nr:HlyD family efflux transporter periplasmic adaptor subunit [Leucothrix mucor]
MNRLSALSVLSVSLLCVSNLPVNLALAEEVVATSVTKLQTTDSVPASILSLKDALVSAEVSANINRINVDVGDTVKQGDELAHLDCREYDARLEQAQADIETVSAQLLSAQSIIQIRLSDIQASKANEELTQAQADAERSRIALAKSKYNAAKSRVNADAAKCQLANIELQRSRNLRQQRLISQQELDKAQTEYRAAQAECSAVESALVGVQSDIGTAQATATAAQAMVKAQQAKTRAAMSNVEAAKTDITAIEAKLSAAKARLKTEALMVSRCTISAPFDGQIVQRMVQLGQRIAPGEKAFQLIAISDAEVTASLAVNELTSLKQAKQIYFEVADKQLPVTLRSVVAIVTGQARTQEVRFKFEQENSLPVGQNGRITW